MRHALALVTAPVALALTALAALTAADARADVAPPSDYVEQCTPEIQCKEGRVCGTFHGEANAECAKAATEAGMEQRCTSWGATVGSAVFCPKGAAAPPPKAAPTRSGCGGCATTPSAQGDVALLASALAVGLALGRRARRR